MKKINWKRMAVLGWTLFFLAVILFGSVVIEKKCIVHTWQDHWKMTAWHPKIKKELESLPSFPESKEGGENVAWYEKYAIIAHALGGIDGKIYTNSREALEYSYEKGNRVFDADLRFTKDGDLVLRHSWLDDLDTPNLRKNVTHTSVDGYGQTRVLREETTTTTEFVNTLIFDKYHSLTFLDLLQIMEEHEDIYVACDVKEDVEETYRQIVRIATENHMEECLGRIIVSFYAQEDYYTIKEIFPFENWVMRQQTVYPQNWQELCLFCLQNDIRVVNIAKEYLDTDDYKILLDKNIKLYVEVVDSVGDIKKYQKKGASGFISNWCYESDLGY